jgi:predicted nucleotidyltransferase
MNEQIIDSVKRGVLRYYESIRKEMRVNSVFLFGSYAKGTPGKSIDIDVEVILGRF